MLPLNSCLEFAVQMAHHCANDTSNYCVNWIRFTSTNELEFVEENWFNFCLGIHCIGIPSSFSFILFAFHNIPFIQQFKHEQKNLFMEHEMTYASFHQCTVPISASALFEKVYKVAIQ